MKALITITTCNRLHEVKKYIWDYLAFVNKDRNFDFVLSLDGNQQEYIDFAENFDIPLISSDEREGVGLSKNRVLSFFPNYDFYFFIEDDIELINENIFNEVIETYHQSNIHHFCNHHSHRMMESWQVGQTKLKACLTGGAQFAFYSKQGIEAVGGFNTLFAKYKRFGHTEHSYRFFHQNLQNGPFIFADEWLHHFLIHSPKQVTSNQNIKVSELGLIEEEQQLIDNKSSFFPLQTITPFQFNHKQLGRIKKVELFLSQEKKKYPLSKGRPRRVALAEHYALRIYSADGALQKIGLILKSIWFYPLNNALKHYIKTNFFGKR